MLTQRVVQQLLNQRKRCGYLRVRFQSGQCASNTALLVIKREAAPRENPDVRAEHFGGGTFTEEGLLEEGRAVPVEPVLGRLLIPTAF